MKSSPLLWLALLVILPTCAVPPFTVPPSLHLNVFAASSLNDVFDEIGKAFESQHPGASISFNFAGSQALRTQIEQGAPADVFASANLEEMNALVAEGYLSPTAPKTFLTNRLVVILPPGNPGALTQLRDLRKPGLKVVLAAEDVPVGKYARHSLDNMAGSYGGTFRTDVLRNVVSNEDNVKQVVAKIQLGEADAGIVYASDAVAAPDLQVLDIPSEWNVVAQYAIASLSKTANAELGSEFVAYVLSPEAQSVLRKWGFGTVK